MNRADYPDDWPELSQAIRHGRAAGRCECTGQCGLHRGRRCEEENGRPAKWANGKVVLTTAHLCSCRPLCKYENHLKAMCNRCHLRVDVALHVANRKKTRHARLAVKDLFS